MGSAEGLRALLAVRLSNLTDETTSPDRQRAVTREHAERQGWDVIDTADYLDTCRRLRCRRSSGRTKADIDAGDVTPITTTARCPHVTCTSSSNATSPWTSDARSPRGRPGTRSSPARQSGCFDLRRDQAEPPRRAEEAMPLRSNAHYAPYNRRNRAHSDRSGTFPVLSPLHSFGRP